MDKAVKKKEERDKQKAARAAEGKAGSPSAEKEAVDIEEVEWDDDMMDIHKDIAASKEASPTDSSSELKRKREGEEDPGSPKKTRKSTDGRASAPPPPPPPPPASDVLEIDQEYVLLTTGNGHDTSHGNAIDGKAGLQENGYPSPVQLATPSTNGSHQAEQRTVYNDRA